MPHGKAFLYGLCGTVQGRLGWAHQEIQVVCHDQLPFNQALVDCLLSHTLPNMKPRP
jgi:hypothetical protein